MQLVGLLVCLGFPLVSSTLRGRGLRYCQDIDVYCKIQFGPDMEVHVSHAAGAPEWPRGAGFAFALFL
jgi:hypothetical protein